MAVGASKKGKDFSRRVREEMLKGRREGLGFFASSAVKGFSFGEAAPDNIKGRLTKR